MPGTTTPIPSHFADDAGVGLEQLGDARVPERVTSRLGSCAVGRLTMSDRGWPIGSASMRNVRLARMSTATLDPLRVLM